MPQGKLKVKTQLPKNVKNKSQVKKGAPVSKRANKPIKPKKNKIEEAQKIKRVISKSLNKAVEDEMRSRACSSNKNLSKAQEAVAAYNKAQTSS